MPTNTGRLALANPIGADSPAQIRQSATTNNGILDNSALYYTGTLVNRGSIVTTLVAGVVYYASDQLQHYVYNGSAWIALQPALNSRIISTSVTAVPGDFLVVSGGNTVTLPAASTSTTFPIKVTAASTVTSTSSVTVSGSNIYGPGLTAASSFVLGQAQASVELVASGSNWIITAGQQDSGWVALTLSTNIVALAGAYVPSARLRGDIVHLSGTMQNNGVTIGSNCATVPVGLRPASSTAFPVVNASGAVVASGTVTTFGLLIVQNFASGNTVGIDHVAYRLP